MDEIKIYMRPLTDKENASSAGDIMRAPSRYHLIDVFKQLRYNRPAKVQEQISKFIEFLELNPELGEPFPPEVVNAAWENK